MFKSAASSIAGLKLPCSLSLVLGPRQLSHPSVGQGLGQYNQANVALSVSLYLYIYLIRVFTHSFFKGEVS